MMVAIFMWEVRSLGGQLPYFLRGEDSSVSLLIQFLVDEILG
jgi:hypothetical protein